MKLGQKASTEHMVLYLNQKSNTATPRFGFVVGKTVGNAVQRNLVKRRARAACYARISQFSPSSDLVLRALPGLASVTWDQFTNELDSALSRLMGEKA